ncbi:hypothetical protein L1887_48406 [Cichorium endivia]|nr:hypothetical protein L1887_48406 [Cichorium endivia]
MSSGTSFADLAHQAWDTAAQLTGFSAIGEQSEDQDSEQQSDADKQQKPNVQTPNGKEYHSESSDTATPAQGPYRAAPGNHPNDPAARINHPDAVNKPAQAASGADRAEPKIDNPSTEQRDQHKQQTFKHASEAPPHDDMGQGIIERALGDQGMTAQRQGTVYDKQLENEMDGSYKDTEKQTKPETAAAELGQPIHSERNQHPDKQHPSADAHQPHAANRGPSWASRPDDAQRAKIAKMKESQKEGTWKRRFSSFNPNSDASAPSTPKPKNNDDHKDSDKQDDPEKERGTGLFSGMFDTHSPARPALNIFGPSGAQRSSTLRSNANKDDDVDAAARNTSDSKGKQHDMTEVNKASRSSSRWAENSNRMRNAFEPPTPSAETATDDNGPQRNDDDVPTPELSPDAQKLRAITKIMLGPNKDKDEPASPDASGSGGPQQAQTRWAQLKKKVRESQKAKREQTKTGAVNLDLAKELQTGILPVFLLKMAVERDEAKRRRIPVLLNHLRLRVTDSVNPMHNTHAVFRIELEYGDGLVKWGHLPRTSRLYQPPCPLSSRSPAWLSRQIHRQLHRGRRRPAQLPQDESALLQPAPATGQDFARRLRPSPERCAGELHHRAHPPHHVPSRGQSPLQVLRDLGAVRLARQPWRPPGKARLPSHPIALVAQEGSEERSHPGALGKGVRAKVVHRPRELHRHRQRARQPAALRRVPDGQRIQGGTAQAFVQANHAHRPWPDAQRRQEGTRGREL